MGFNKKYLDTGIVLEVVQTMAILKIQIKFENFDFYFFEYIMDSFYIYLIF